MWWTSSVLSGGPWRWTVDRLTSRRYSSERQHGGGPTVDGRRYRRRRRRCGWIPRRSNESFTSCLTTSPSTHHQTRRCGCGHVEMVPVFCLWSRMPVRASRESSAYQPSSAWLAAATLWSIPLLLGSGCRWCCALLNCTVGPHGSRIARVAGHPFRSCFQDRLLRPLTPALRQHCSTEMRPGDPDA
jgi:hypothetical protein